MEFKLSKVDRLMVNAAAKDTGRPVLHCVHIKKGAIEAANGFILMERKLDYNGDEVLLDIADIAKHKDAKGLEGVVYTSNGDNEVKAIGQDINILNKQEGNFPDTKKLYPTEEPVFKIALGRSELLNMLKCLGKDEEIIKFQFYGTEKPAKIETTSGEVTGLIMPIQATWDSKS